MKIVFFIQQDALFPLQRLHHEVIDHLTGDQVEIIQRLSDFEKRLVQIPRNILVLILYGHDDKLLNRLKSVEGNFDGLKTILILPALDREDLLNGLWLRPKYITSVNDDFAHITAVVQHIISNDCCVHSNTDSGAF